MRSFAYDLELGRFTQAGERWLEGLIDHQEWDRLRRRFRREEKRERKRRPSISDAHTIALDRMGAPLE